MQKERALDADLGVRAGCKQDCALPKLVTATSWIGRHHVDFKK